MPRPLTDDERAVLEAATPFLSLTSTDGWPQLLALMDEIVERAENAMKLNTSATMDTEFRRQWQQRNHFRQAILTHISTLLEHRREILEDINRVEEEITW